MSVLYIAFLSYPDWLLKFDVCIIHLFTYRVNRYMEYFYNNCNSSAMQLNSVAGGVFVFVRSPDVKLFLARLEKVFTVFPHSRAYTGLPHGKVVAALPRGWTISAARPRKTDPVTIARLP